MINDNSYINIQAFMVKDLKLKGNELLIYAIIYGFSQDGKSQFNGSLQYLADWTNSTKQGVLKALKTLCAKQLILKNEYVENGVKYCAYIIGGYTTKFNEGIKQSLMGYSTKFNEGIKQSLTNNIYNTIKDNINDNIADNNEKREKTEKVNFSVFMETVYNLIISHNSKQTEAKRKIAISKDLFTFESKEGRMLVDMVKSRTPKEIVSALKNYLFVANMKNTWVNMFTFNAFCKGIDKYLPEYFDYESFADYNIDYDHSSDVDLLFVNKMENEPRFDNYLFDKHVKEWIANGCPENEEYYKLQETWR